MRLRVIPYVMPLLFAYDASAEKDDGGSVPDDSQQRAGPQFLGLATVRTNMQVCTPPHDQQAGITNKKEWWRDRPALDRAFR